MPAGFQDRLFVVGLSTTAGKVDGSTTFFVSLIEAERKVRTVGRPPKYNKKTLTAAVEAYFDSITRVVTVTEKVDTGRKDGDGHKIYETRQVLNKRGKPAEVLEFIEPPTVGSLCMALRIHRSTWAEYCDPDEHPEYKDITTWAKEQMRTYLEKQLLIRKDVKGVIFDLQNNHGYTEKRQLDLSDRASKAVSSANLTLDERKAFVVCFHVVRSPFQYMICVPLPLPVRCNGLAGNREGTLSISNNFARFGILNQAILFCSPLTKFRKIRLLFNIILYTI